MSSDPAHIGLHHICLPSDKSVSKRIGGSSARTATGVVPDRSRPTAMIPIQRRSGANLASRFGINVYLNNRLEQDHRGIKDRYTDLRGRAPVSLSRPRR